MLSRRRYRPVVLEDYPSIHYSPRQRRHPLRWLLALSTLIVLGGFIAHHASANNNEAAANEPGSGQLLLQHRRADGTMLREPMLHLDSRADIHIAGMVATVTLQQRFRNDLDQWAEGVYVFPLPENAAISYMAMTIGERRIVGRISEKMAARQKYEQAKAEGKKAALVEQERPNLFTQSVANIAPGESITVELHYQQPVRFNQGEFSLRLPTTLTPRYIPGISAYLPENSEESNTTSPWGWAMPTTSVADADRITPFMMTQADDLSRNPIAIDITLASGLPLASISSPYHDIRIERAGDQHHIHTRSTTVPMDRDFVLQWRAAVGQAPAAALLTERAQTGGDESTYGLLMIMPPDLAQANREGLPRQTVFIVDTSGSMQGTSISQAKDSLQYALSQLRPQDEFDIIEFNSRFSRLFGVSLPASGENIARARHFVGNLRADGGTEMAPALNAAMTTADREGLVKQIIFITDGSVGNESALLQQIHQQLGHARLFTVGIGSAPNSFFMRKAAEFGRGSHVHIGDTQEVEHIMKGLFDKLTSPMLTQLSIDWPVGVKAQVWPQQIPDLYQGEPLMVYARFDGGSAPSGSVTVRGIKASSTATGDGQHWQHTVALPAAGAVPDHEGAIARLWARQQIAALLDEKVMGKPEAEVRAEVLPLALRHSLLSPYTSFVAVEDVVSRPSSEPVVDTPVPNLIAQGQTMLARPMSYPNTAANLPLHMFGGLIALGLLILRCRPRAAAPSGAKGG